MSLATETHPARLAAAQGKPKQPAAHVIRSDAEAIEVAHRVAGELAKGASERDRNRILPFEEIELFSQSGLWGILVPKNHGGAGVSFVTLAEVVAIISAADPSLGQIPQNHYAIVDAVGLVGTEAQKKHYFAEILKGHRFGNAFSEQGGKHVLDIKTRLSRNGSRLPPQRQEVLLDRRPLRPFGPGLGARRPGPECPRRRSARSRGADRSPTTGPASASAPPQAGR